MSKLQIFPTGTDAGEVRHRSDTADTPCGFDFVKNYMGRFGAAFREVGWIDRLSLILAALLGMALVLLLSPILFVSWLRVQTNLTSHPDSFSGNAAEADLVHHWCDADLRSWPRASTGLR